MKKSNGSQELLFGMKNGKLKRIMMKTRTYLYILAVSLMAISCDNEVVGTGAGTGIDADGSLVAFSGAIVDELSMESPEGCDGASVSETRSTISNGNFSSWDAGDMVSISDGHRLYYQYGVSNIESNPTSCSFAINRENNGSAFEKKDGYLEKDYYVFYPAEAVEEWDGNTVVAQLYSEQDYKENADHGLMGAYMASKAAIQEKDGVKDVHFSFKHCASVIEVDLSQFSSNSIGASRPAAVSIMTNSGISLTGRFEYDIDSKEYTVYNDDETEYATSHQSDVVTVGNISEGAQVVRFYVLPVKIVGGVTITVRTVDNEFYTKSTTGDIGNASDAISITGVTNAVPCAPYYKKISFGTITNSTKVNDYMATIPSNTYFSMISTPGAHNSASSVFASAASDNDIARRFSRTQAMPIDAVNEQGQKYGLVNRYGVRAYDLRAPYKTSNNAGSWVGLIGTFTPADMTKQSMPIFHGITQTAYKFNDVVTSLASYVRAHRTEAITILFDKEDNLASGIIGTVLQSENHTKEMWSVLNEIFADQQDVIHVGFNDKMTLGDVRGKLVVINRVGSDSWDDNGVTVNKVGAELCPYATNLYGWSDNPAWVRTEFGTSVSDNRGPCIAFVEDEYVPVGNSINAITSHKTEVMGNALENMSRNLSYNNYFFTYSAIAASGSIPNILFSIDQEATSMNPRAVSLIDNHQGPVGYIYGDYLGSDDQNGHLLTKAILGQNAKYIYAGRTRCKYASSGVGTGGGGESADDGPVYIKRK